MNYYSQRQARRESFREVGETCPAVDAALEAAAEAVKAQTTALREAHIDALHRAILAEEKADELERENTALLERIAELESEIRNLEAHA